MHFARNLNAEFTKWVVRAGLLPTPFVLIDVGVRGGENIRWRTLGDCLVVRGFDPIEEVVQKLDRENRGRSNRHYHYMALGNADGEQTLYFNPINPTASSMYQQAAAGERHWLVPIRRLDSLLAEGVIPKADYIKIDVEGFEQAVLLGARKLLGAGVLGLQTETSFGISSIYPKSHFAAMMEIALDNHLLVFDLTFNRIPCASFQHALKRKGFEPTPRRMWWASRRRWTSFSREISSRRSTIPAHWTSIS